MRSHASHDHLIRLLLLASLLVMATGLLLFTQFHIGPGAHATALAGISKAWWRDMHRAAAVLFLITLVHHLHIHWRPIRLLFTRLPRIRGQLAMTLLSGVVIMTGLSAWFLFPAHHYLHAPHSARHTCIDIHNISGLVLLVGSLLHLGRRWRFVLTPAGPKPSRCEKAHRTARVEPGAPNRATL